MRRFGSLAALLLSLVAPSSGAAAQTVLPPEQEKVAVEAMSRLKSPYTAFHTVDMCPSAAALRDSIRVKAATGMTTEELVEDVISRHGEQLRILPKRSGVGLWAWLATPLVLVGGVALIAYRLRRDQRDAPPPMAAGALSEEDRGELTAALREWDERRGEDA
jgi:cytochrome c-type biogenesis protein CcmH/NrfF